ncbi:MAG TPA: hypothetical protein ENI29_19335, partial [bacterium]|nr:hypothetical protein [bacterium]
MKLTNKLELTYIPTTYWNEPLSGFELITEGKQLPTNTNFFLLWSSSLQSEDELTESIKLIFPSIPANKLLSCKINLGKPFNLSNKDKQKTSEKGFFKISTLIGKIMPISPAIKLLYQLEILESSDRKIKHYSNSIKTWAFLTKLIFEQLNKGQFIPILEQFADKKYLGQWRLLLKTPNDNIRFKTILSNSSWPVFCLPINFINDNEALKTDGLWHPSYLFSIFMDKVGDHLIRSTLKKSKFQTFSEFYSTEITKE